MEEICLRPIGVAHNDVKAPRFGKFADVVTEIVLDGKLSEALDGIEDYSHVVIVYWMHNVKRQVVTHRPQGNPNVPVVGIFSCRCPERPNPIAITTVRLLEHKGNVIKVRGLDVIDGTPIIDIKPYWPQYDRAENAIVPEWIGKLEF